MRRPGRRGDSGRRCRRGGEARRRRVCAHGRAAAGLLRRRASELRSGVGERGRGVRPARDAARRGERLRGDRPPRPRSRDAAGAVRSLGRPLRRLLPPAHTRDRRRSLGRRQGTPVRVVAVFVVATPVSADPGRADRADLGRLPRRAARGDRQGRRRDRAARQGAHGPVRQDGHADARASRARAGRRLRRNQPPTSCCASPPRSTSCPRTCSRRRSSTRAQDRGLRLSAPAEVEEGRGQGIEGRVDGRRVAVGSSALAARARLRRRRGGGARTRRERRSRPCEDRSSVWTAGSPARS